ncbi:MAG TPA: DUF6463 family protein [Allosphingosinicella sp.]|uniref:DUF6463 family protein n=1 Tax=Allosphingosinicella sp. TaxID=2823234 RepID=UPI002ED7C6F9
METTKTRTAWIGKWIAAVGFFHSMGGFFLFYTQGWQMIADRGLIASVNDYDITATAFWFLITGLLLILLGMLMDGMERQGFSYPSWLKWALAALVFILIAPMPATGAWLLIVPVVGLFLRK